MQPYIRDVQTKGERKWMQKQFSTSTSKEKRKSSAVKLISFVKLLIDFAIDLNRTKAEILHNGIEASLNGCGIIQSRGCQIELQLGRFMQQRETLKEIKSCIKYGERFEEKYHEDGTLRS